MCDYCGCRGQPTIEELSTEHETLLDLTYRLRRDAARGDHPAVTRMLVSELLPLLRRHTDKEERGLFAQLRATWAADDRLRTLVDEHRRIEDLVDVVMRGEVDWVATVVQLGDELSEHILDEETDLFPYALYELGDAQWAAVEAVHEGVADATHGVAGERFASTGRPR